MFAHSAAPLTLSLREATLDVLWRQWRAIGGAAAGGPARMQVDPEALCLASLVLQPHEPRLWTTMIDWLRLGAPLVSVQRLRNLAEEFPGSRDLLSRLAATVVEEGKDARFRALLAGLAGARAERRTRIGSYPPKQRSGGPALQASVALLLRLRAAFGVGIKADLLAFLLGQRLRVSVAMAAAALCYSTSAIFRALQDLLTAGFVKSTDQPTAAEYWLDAGPWYPLLGGANAVAYWGFWREALAYVAAVLGWEQDARRRVLSEYARATSLRKVAEHHEADLVRAGLLGPELALPQSASLEEWREFHERLAQRMLDRV
jgi:hypothetical protein